LTTGKFVDSVVPVTKALLSAAMPIPMARSSPRPPRYVE
jgi:hypothetical protein